MKKNVRFLIVITYLFSTLFLIYVLGFLLFQLKLTDLIIDWTFWGAILFYFGSISELLHWAKIGKRSEMSDLIAIAFFFFVILFITKDWLTAMMGAFSIYLWVGVAELKDYPVINKLLIISLVTYNIIFIAGLISFYLGDPFVLNTTFAFSFWIILGLGFLLFGRKYIVVWRFMSPAYLTLFLYILAWLAVAFVNEYTPIEFIYNSPLESESFTIVDFILNIYFVLIVVNWIVYFLTGPLLDKMLGIKRVEDENLIKLVDDVKQKIGIENNVKVGFGKYPILNAMAYGSVFDKRIAIIAESIDQIPEDELKGIVAHELAHTKGMHTLILTFITSGDLIVRMFLGIPATYYDYTFGDPKIPMISFILLNLLIYMFLYIFVRILEGKADLMSKEAGYGKELVKALYNLESFYATGREIGLNTMLLCEEKITKENQILDYFDTAEYIYHSMIKPSRGSLLGNMLNSHPPTYHRVAAILSEKLKPGKEALLPFICLKRSKQRKYAKKFEIAREEFKKIATEKFKEKFNIENIANLLESLDRKKIYQLSIKKDFIFKHKITKNIILGKIEDVKFQDNICEPDIFIIKRYKSGQIEELSNSFYRKSEYYLNALYYIENSPLILKDITLSEDSQEGEYVFEDINGELIKKPISKIKLPNPVELFKDFEQKEVFLKLKDKLKVLHVKKVIPAKNLEDFQLEFEEPINPKNFDEKIISFKDLIIRPHKIYFSIRRNNIYRQTEVDLIRWLISNDIRCFIYLKKPVNNLEVGYIEDVRHDFLEENEKYDKNNTDANYIIIRNIFGNRISIPYKTLEIISFEYPTALIQKKSETSFASKLGYKLVKKLKPESVYY
ncbi:MAG: M48 family metalloprotease [Promethearchaeota archaeon]